MGSRILSFESCKKGKTNLWSVDGSSLSYHQQNKLGSTLAHEAINYVRKTGDTPLLTMIVRDMRAKEIDGVIVGFMEEVAAMAAGFR